MRDVLVVTLGCVATGHRHQIRPRTDCAPANLSSLKFADWIEPRKYLQQRRRRCYKLWDSSSPDCGYDKLPISGIQFAAFVCESSLGRKLEADATLVLVHEPWKHHRNQNRSNERMLSLSLPALARWFKLTFRKGKSSFSINDMAIAGGEQACTLHPQAPNTRRTFYRKRKLSSAIFPVEIFYPIKYLPCARCLHAKLHCTHRVEAGVALVVHWKWIFDEMSKPRRNRCCNLQTTPNAMHF